MRTKELFKFIKERHRIHEKKELGHPRPWTKDPILQSYRFCNVYRELDTVTKWIAKNWREPHKNDKDLWFAMVVARLVNWPETLDDLGYPVLWEPDMFVECLEERRKDGDKVFTGAYMVHAGSSKYTSKAAYLVKETLNPMWENRRKIRPVDGDSLADFYARLHACHDMGSFMAGQVIADVKYTKPLLDANDWYSWAISGPGSKRGLNRVLGSDPKSPWKEKDWYNKLVDLHDQIGWAIKKEGMPHLPAQDLQNVLCEWDKYERVRLGEGRPRSKYNGI